MKDWILSQDQEQGFSSHSTGSYVQCNQKEIKGIQFWKEEMKMNLFSGWHDNLYRKSDEIYKKKLLGLLSEISKV